MNPTYIWIAVIAVFFIVNTSFVWMITRPGRDRDEHPVEVERFCGMLDDPRPDVCGYTRDDEPMMSCWLEPGHTDPHRDQHDDVIEPFVAGGPVLSPIRVHAECFDSWHDGKRPCGRCETFLSARAKRWAS